MSIPKRIFQTWKEKEVKQPVLKSWQDSWKRHNPDYDYELWDDADNRNFIKQNYPDFLAIFDGYDKNIKRADAIRYFYLYHYGGVYADLDFECLKKFDTLLDLDGSPDVVFGTLGRMDNPSLGLHVIPNAIMMGKKNSDFFKLVIDVLKTIGNNDQLGPELATGPILLFICYSYYVTKIKNIDLLRSLYGKNIFENCNPDFCSKMFVLEPKILYPINWNNSEHRAYYQRLNSETPAEIFPDSYAVTYWMHSW